ncbi:MAG: hypothetical protein GY797_03055 [Deltaproteobacteria bacterium]|nr:hypothetical protein [Deltaproteobacteria bacterium]
MSVLKLKKNDETREIAFELDYMKSLTIRQRFQMMKMKSEEIKRIITRKHGYGKSFEIIKRA